MNRVSLLPALLLLFLSACTGAPDNTAPHNAGVIDDPASKAESAAQPDGTIDDEAPETDTIGPPPTLVYQRSITLDGQDLLLHFLGAEDGSAFYTRLLILDPADDALLYETSLPDWDMIPGIPADLIEGRKYKDDILEFIDVDFDSHTDIRLYWGQNGNWNQHYLYIIRDATTGGFTVDRYGLEGLGLPIFDAESKVVRSMQRSSAISHWYYWHEYRDGVLVTTQEVSQQGVGVPADLVPQMQEVVPDYGNDRSVSYIKRYVLDEGSQELELVEEYFACFYDSTLERFDQFDVDSDKGRALMNLVGEYQYSDFWK